jgi:hypothetical protein
MSDAHFKLARIHLARAGLVVFAAFVVDPGLASSVHQPQNKAIQFNRS